MEYNLKARADAFAKPRATLSVWEAMELLDTLVDESDPDTEASQITHLLQTAESMRRDGKPDWMQVTGLVHDLGKLLYFFGSEGQWDVVVSLSFPFRPLSHSPVLLSRSFPGRHLCRWCRLPAGQDRLPRFLQGEPRPRPPSLLDPARPLLGWVRTRQCHALMGPRRIPLRGLQDPVNLA